MYAFSAFYLCILALIYGKTEKRVSEEKGEGRTSGGRGFILLQLNDYIMWQNLYFYTLFCDWGQKFILLSAFLPLSILEYCF